MELIRRASPNFKFSDGSEVTFEVEAMTKEDRRLLLDQSRSKRKNFEKKDEDIFDKYDMERFTKLTILRTVKGWSGLKNKHLSIIYDCEKGDQWQFKGDGRRETEIPFSEEAKRELAEMNSEQFRTFLSAAMDVIEEENVRAKEAELKN